MGHVLLRSLLLFVLLGSVTARASDATAFLAVMPLAGDFGNEGFSYAPPLQLRFMQGAWTLGAGGSYAWTNSDAGLVDAPLQKGWGYFLEFEYLTHSDEADVHVVETHREVVGSQYVMGVGTIVQVRFYETDGGIEHRIYQRGLRLGLSGGRKQRDFGPVLDELGKDGTALPLQRPDGRVLTYDAPSGLFGTAVQHRVYAGHEWILLVPPMFAVKAYTDLQFMLAETIDDSLGSLGDTYVATDATREALAPGLVDRFGWKAGVEFRIGYLFTHTAVGVEPGTGGGLFQLQCGAAFAL